MRRALVLSIALLLAGSRLGPAASLAAGLCRAGETTYFSCATARHKVISLCGSHAAGVQYRYGTADKLELAYPDEPAQGLQPFGYAHYLRYRTERSEVGFGRHGVDYAVFDYTEGGRRSAGVRVTTSDGAEHEVACARAIRGRLDVLGKSLRCDPDNALNGGRCP